MTTLYRTVTGSAWHRPSCVRLKLSKLDLMTLDSRYIGEEQMCKVCSPGTRGRRYCFICFGKSLALKHPPRPCKHNGGVLVFHSASGREFCGTGKYVWPAQLRTGKYQPIESRHTLVIDGPPS